MTVGSKLSARTYWFCIGKQAYQVRNIMAVVYMSRGQYAKAVPILESALAGRLGEDTQGKQQAAQVGK
jgi:hypothetical protein